jgi:hypothetical protein
MRSVDNFMDKLVDIYVDNDMDNLINIQTFTQQWFSI